MLLFDSTITEEVMNLYIRYYTIQYWTISTLNHLAKKVIIVYPRNFVHYVSENVIKIECWKKKSYFENK